MLGLSDISLYNVPTMAQRSPGWRRQRRSIAVSVESCAWVPPRAYLDFQELIDKTRIACGPAAPPTRSRRTQSLFHLDKSHVVDLGKLSPEGVILQNVVAKSEAFQEL